MFVDLILVLLSLIVFLYDFLTFPIYWIVQQPWKTRAKFKKIASWKQLESKEDYLSWGQETSSDNAQYRELIVKNKVDTVHKVWTNAVAQHGQKRCFGTREVLGEEDEKQSSGKVFKKLLLGDYKWMNFEEAQATSLNIGSGLIALGLKAGQPITIYSETRSEWILAAFGAFSQSLMVSTLYTNLGEEAVAHGINETEVSVVITSHSLLPKFKTLLDKCPKVTHVIYIEDQIFKSDKEGFKEGVEIISFNSVVALGEKNSIPPNPPTKDDIAIIMYTSGSTGVPKGVMVTHQNMVATATCILYLREFDSNSDMYIAYLPLAHILELLAETTYTLLGIPIGFSSPNTMTDMSSAIRRGDKGDVSLLHPTLMCTVPLILDRVYKNVLDGISKQGPTFKKIFNFVYQQKLQWNLDGFQTPILDKLVFNKLKMILGGRMDFLLVGSAPLSPSTQEFIRVCLGINISQGYSMTETTCSGTCQPPGEPVVGLVGGPMAGVEIRLINWEEGNYKITDKPLPRGEIVLGGATVTQGYYKNEEKTAEDFFKEDGKQFFRSGDIGEVQLDGSLRLIDRKKDLVKLQLGEYVSLGKVEAQMKTNPLVDNICVYADSFKTHTVALIVPVYDPLIKVAKQLKKDSELPMEELCKDSDIVKEVVKQLGDHGKRNGLEKFEIPTVITLCSEVWVPESGLVTAAFKLKRKALQTEFQADIDRMYGKK